MQVHLHMFFILFVALAFFLISPFLPTPSLRVAFFLTLFGSLVLHEMGHILLARRLGGIADEMVIGPLGGLSAARVPYEPQSELVVLMAGPVINGLLCVVSGAVLVTLEDNAPLQQLFNPLALSGLSSLPSSPAMQSLRLVFWVNWSLVLVNLLPAYPFDGGRIVQTLLALLWPEVNLRHIRLTVCRLSQIVSLVLLVLALVLSQSKEPALFQESPLDPQIGWFGLVILATFVFFNARRERLQQSEVEQDEETVFGYDFSQGYTSLERGFDGDDAVEATHPQPPAPLGLFGQWLEQRRESRRRRQLEQEQEDEQRVDEILSRLHDQGMRSLSHEDRLLLERVSRRYRSRPS